MQLIIKFISGTLLITSFSAFSLAEQAQSTSSNKNNIRVTECIKAFGDEQFCQCIDKQMHSKLSFADYIFVTTKSKQAVGYDILPEENQKMIDSAYSARQRCVKN